MAWRLRAAWPGLCLSLSPSAPPKSCRGKRRSLTRRSASRQYKLTDEERELKANDLESQLEMGRKYGTLTPEQQKQYVDQITGLYSKPEQQGSLLQRIHKAIHPTGTVRQAAQPLPNADSGGRDVGGG